MVTIVKLKGILIKKKIPWDSNEHPVTDTAAASSELAGHDYKSSHPPKKPLQSKTRQYTADGSIENLPFSKNYSSPYLHSGGRSTHTNGENVIDEYYCYHTVLEKHGQIGLHLLSRKSYRVYLHCSEEPKWNHQVSFLGSCFFPWSETFPIMKTVCIIIFINLGVQWNN